MHNSVNILNTVHLEMFKIINLMAFFPTILKKKDQPSAKIILKILLNNVN